MLLQGYLPEMLLELNSACQWVGFGICVLWGSVYGMIADSKETARICLGFWGASIVFLLFGILPMVCLALVLAVLLVASIINAIRLAFL